MRESNVQDKSVLAAEAGWLERMLQALREADAEGLRLRRQFEEKVAPLKVLTPDDLLVRAR